MKTCKQCLIPKDTSEFWVRKDSLDGMNARCRACCNHRQRGYKNKRPQLYARLNKNNRVKYRKEVLDAYGHACACCGETRWQFLAIDHVNGGGCKHRDKVGTMGVYLDARKRGFPKDYRLLCHNCNQSIAWFGSCPHYAPDLTIEEASRKVYETSEPSEITDDRCSAGSAA